LKLAFSAIFRMMLRANRTLLNKCIHLEPNIPSFDIQRSVSGIRALGRLMKLPKPNGFLEAFESWLHDITSRHSQQPTSVEYFLRGFFSSTSKWTLWTYLLTPMTRSSSLESRLNTGNGKSRQAISPS
jgi:hypothetical protein